MLKEKIKKCSCSSKNMWSKIWLIFVFYVCLLKPNAAILNAYPEKKDITEDPNFNCRWDGGLEPKLICSCLKGDEEFYIEKSSIPTYDLCVISISNCGTIRFGTNSIYDMRSLRLIQLYNISNLIFEDQSLYWTGQVRSYDHPTDFDPSLPSLKLNIEKSKVNQISNNAIKGRMNQITFNDVVIENIAPFGFSSLEQTQHIAFYSVQFKNVQPQGFKKFSTEKLIIKDSTFELIPSRAFYDVTVKYEFVLDNVTIDTLKPAGFIIHNPQIFSVQNSVINNLNGEGFKVMTRGDVFIKNNVFNNTGVGAFHAISLNIEEIPDRKTLTMERDIFHQLSKDSLIVNETSFIPRYIDVQISEKCDCGNLERYFKNIEDTSALKCQTKEGFWITVEDFKAYNCSILDTTVGTVGIVLISCASLLVVVIIGVLCYVKRLYRCGSYGDGDEKQGKLSMIVPDGRTYRETELHVVVERADLLTTDL